VSKFPKSLLLVGAGKMGSALLCAWLDAGMKKKSIVAFDKAISIKGHSIKSLNDLKNIPECVVIAVKPQSMDEVLPELWKRFGAVPLYISIAAGKTTAYLKKNLGDAAIIRAMPNTPALIGRGMSALYAGSKVSKKQKQYAVNLFESVGEVIWLNKETQMDAVTAISGSGPAYVFLILESLIAAGKSHGLPEDMAKTLAIQTLLGSTKLAKISKQPLAKLRANVTSKGGTTEAALEVLIKDNHLKLLFKDAINAAARRSKELA
jgi:pyrroline-5-carboxylate reductase